MPKYRITETVVIGVEADTAEDALVKYLENVYYREPMPTLVTERGIEKLLPDGSALEPLLPGPGRSR